MLTVVIATKMHSAQQIFTLLSYKLLYNVFIDMGLI